MAGGGRDTARAVVVAGLAAGLTKGEVARQATVSDRTLRRWLAQDDFRRQVEDARAELISRTVGRLADATTDAVATLRALLDTNYPPSVRLGAARAILEMATRYREAETMEQRLATLEAVVAAQERAR
jgi:lambda repressor-like predicted transcriptional regulator